MTDFNHAHNKKAEIAQQIHNSYNTTSFEKSEENDLEKSLDELEKGGKRAYIGEIRTFGGREYIRTSQGWKYHGKGTGKKAQEHKAGAAKHTKDTTSASKDKERSKYGKKGYKPTSVAQLRKDIVEAYSKSSLAVQKQMFVDAKAKYFPEEVSGNQATSPGSQKKDDTKHISDMTATEKKVAAKQLGIDIKGKSTAEINKELVGKNVDKALQEWKDKRKLKTSKGGPNVGRSKDGNEYDESGRAIGSKKEEGQKIDSNKAQRDINTYRSTKSKKEKETAFNQLRQSFAFGDMKPSFISDKAITFTGPGPMKISDDHDHESYYFTVEGVDSDRRIKVPTEEDIKKHKAGRKEVLEGVKSGSTVWFTPGGQVFKVSFREKEDGSGEMVIGGRKNSAVGKGSLFERVPMKKIDAKSIAQQMEKFNSRDKVRKYLESKRNSIAQWD